jgi:hypothetical protein
MACKEITIDGKRHVFADREIKHIAWTPVPAKRQLPNKAFFQVYLEGSGKVKIPMKTDRKKLKMVTEGLVKGSMGEFIPFKYKNGMIELELNDDNTGLWLYIMGIE